MQQDDIVFDSGLCDAAIDAPQRSVADPRQSPDIARSSASRASLTQRSGRLGREVLSGQHPVISIRSRRNAIAACIASAFALGVPACATANGVTWIVNTCDQGTSGDLGTHTGTLRFAAANADVTGGDTIDMTTIGCSLISLETSAVALPQHDLKIKGPGMNALNIEAKYGVFPNSHFTNDRVFNHTGTGALKIYDLQVSKGYSISSAGTAKGGCIASDGSLGLYHVKVTNCQAKTDTGSALGGGLYAKQGIFFKYGVLGGDVLSGNTASGGASGSSAGGGLYSGNVVSVKYSTVTNNAANASGIPYAHGGAIRVTGTTFIGSSTIANNTTQGNEGAIDSFDPGNYLNDTMFIANSTISGNTAAGLVGGVYTDSKKVYVYSSTIAYNTAGIGSGTSYFSPGLSVAANTNTQLVTLESSILASNTYGPSSVENDFSMAYNNVTVAGSDNLIRLTTGNPNLPSNTQRFTCPFLGPLRDNGGQTPTLALGSGSPAIDKGNINGIAPLLSTPYPYDQRSSPSYPRVSGPIGDPSPVADMGAYEVQQDEIIFNARFEGCPEII